MVSIKLSVERKNIPYILICFAAFHNIIIYFIQFFTSRINIGVKNLSSFVYYIVFFLLFFIASSEITTKLFKKKAWEFPVLFVLFSLSYGMTYIFNETAITSIKDSSSINFVLFYLLAVYGCARITDDYDKIFRYIRNGAYFSFAYNIITFLLTVSRSKGTVEDYDIVFGYNCIFAALVLYKSFIKDKKWYDGVMGLALMATTLAIGSRGPMLVLMIYVIIEYFFRKIIGGTTISKASFVVVSGTLFFVVKNYFILICERLYIFFYRMGIESRTLEKLLSGTDELADSSGRDILWGNAIKAINEFKLFGEGIFGDRQFANGYYIHNIFIEIYAQYGVILGTAFLALIIISNLMALIKNRNAEIVLILTCYVWVFFNFSSSYLMNATFWVLFGISMNIANTKKKENKG